MHKLADESMMKRFEESRGPMGEIFVVVGNWQGRGRKFKNYKLNHMSTCLLVSYLQLLACLLACNCQTTSPCCWTERADID